MRTLGPGYITMCIASAALSLLMVSFHLLGGSLPERLSIAHRWLAMYLLPWAGVLVLVLALARKLPPRRVFVTLSAGALCLHVLWILLGLGYPWSVAIFRVLSWTRIACTIALIAWSIAMLRREGEPARAGRSTLVACAAFGVLLVIGLMFVPWPAPPSAPDPVPATAPPSPPSS